MLGEADDVRDPDQTKRREDVGVEDQVACQVLEAPESTTRLVPDIKTALRQASRDGEIRLTYGELTALIADAVNNLRE